MKDLKFEKPKTTIQEESNGSYGKFVISPLDRGYGLTLGNALRRVLISSLPGTAIVNVRIEGVQHEFSTIPGVIEDVMTIVLNLKKIVLKADTSDPKFVTDLEIHHGEGEVTAADLICNSEVEVINPVPLATVRYISN